MRNVGNGNFKKTYTNESGKKEMFTQFLCFHYQFIKVFHCSILRLNAQIIGNIVPKIYHRRFENWAKPCSRNSCFFQVFKSRSNSFYIANAVSITVSKAPRINLIKLDGLVGDKKGKKFIGNLRH